jgi:YggT family protein
MNTIFGIINALLTLLVLAIFIRALLSWFYPVGKDPWTKLLVDITEPILAPIRNVLARIMPIPMDFSPIVAWLLIVLLQNLLSRAYYGG